MSVEHCASKMFDLMHTPDLLGWVLIKLSDLIGFTMVMI